MARRVVERFAEHLADDDVDVDAVALEVIDVAGPRRAAALAIAIGRVAGQHVRDALEQRIERIDRDPLGTLFETLWKGSRR